MGARGEARPKAVGPTVSWCERAWRTARWIVERERLPELQPAARRDPGFLRWLFAPEPLPRPSEGESPRDVPFFSWVFRRECLRPPSKESEP